MTGVINAAHANGTRVVLTVQSFAWSSTGVTRQKALLGSAAASRRTSPARSRRPCAIAAPTASTSTSSRSSRPTPTSSPRSSARSAPSSTRSRGLPADVRHDRLDRQLPDRGRHRAGRRRRGRRSWATTTGAARRTRSARSRRSAARLRHRRHDHGLRSVASRPPRSSSACRTTAAPGRPPRSALARARTSRARRTARRRPSSTARPVTTRPTTAGKWDPVEGVAWTVYRRENCTADLRLRQRPGARSTTTTRKALGLKYDVINRYNLRGAGIWALGYDGTRPELYDVLKDKFITDTVPPGHQRGLDQLAVLLAQRRRADGHGDDAGQRHRPRPVRLGRPASDRRAGPAARRCAPGR